LSVNVLTNKTGAALAGVQLAIAGAKVALDAPIAQGMPPAGGVVSGIGAVVGGSLPGKSLPTLGDGQRRFSRHFST
jgi:hypothetical protein